MALKHRLIKKSHIIFTKAAKPFLRAAKGTVQRSPTLKLYKEEIDDLYTTFRDIKLKGLLAKTIGSSNNTALEDQQVNKVADSKINHFSDEVGVRELELELKKIVSCRSGRLHSN